MGRHKRWLSGEMEFLNKQKTTTTKPRETTTETPTTPTQAPTQTPTRSPKLIQLFMDEVPHDMYPNVHSDALLTTSNVTVESLAKLYKKMRKALSKAVSQDGPQDLEFQKPRTGPQDRKPEPPKPQPENREKPQGRLEPRQPAQDRPEPQPEPRQPAQDRPEPRQPAQKPEQRRPKPATVRTAVDPCARWELGWGRRFKRDNLDEARRYAETFVEATMKKTWFNPYEAIRKYLNSVNTTPKPSSDVTSTSTLATQVRYDTLMNYDVQSSESSELRYKSITNAERSLQQTKIERRGARINPIELRYDTLTNAEKAEKRRLAAEKMRLAQLAQLKRVTTVTTTNKLQHHTRRGKGKSATGKGKKCCRSSKCRQKHQRAKSGSSGHKLRRVRRGARYPRDPNHPKIFSARRMEPDEPDDNEVEDLTTDITSIDFSSSNLDDTLAWVSMFVIVFVGLMLTGTALYGIYRCCKTERIRFVETPRIEKMVTLAAPAPVDVKI